MANAQSFCSASIAADCTSSSGYSAPELVHPEVFPVPHKILLLAVTRVLLPGLQYLQWAVSHKRAAGGQGLGN